MQDSRKLEFVAHQTRQALEHMTKTPNLVTPKGMSHEKMMSFVTQVTKHGLQHFDSGGTVLNGPATTAATPLNTTSGGGLGALSTSLGTQNNFTPSAAPIQQGTNTAQLNAAYTGANDALTNQNNIATATQPGVTQGVNTQSTLAPLLNAEVQGYGPNPAQAALNQNTNANINAEAALMASNRGASANPGAVARTAAEQGASIQQNAVGQAATLKAQQQLAAQNQEENLAATQIGEGTNTATADTTGNQGEQTILQGANTAANNATVSSQNNVNTVGQATAAGNQSAAGSILGGLASGVSSALGFAKGGTVPAPNKADPKSHVGRWLKNGGAVTAANASQKAVVKGDSLKNDKVPAMLSAGEVVLDKDTLADKGPIGQMARALAAHIAQRNKKNGSS